MDQSQEVYNTRTLRVYLYYRLILASLLYLMYEAELTNYALGQINPGLFRISSLGYVIIALCSLILLLDKAATRSLIKITVLLAIDLMALMVLIHASGGVSTGLGYLLIITTAIASMFLPGKLALAFAALVSIAIITDTVYLNLGGKMTRPVFSAGSLGFLVFITAITFRYLTERIHQSSLEAAQQSEYAKQVVKLAQHIVTRMRTGIVVVDADNNVELINESAIQLINLDKESNYIGQGISQLSNLGELLAAWRQNPISGMAKVHTLDFGQQVRINFASLKSNDKQLTILYLEDYRTLIQQVQQLKLASLGRLTASIAHEVRNPLGAISHAAQLLSESESIDNTDKRFTEIILQHSQRVNEIIENTTAISKRKEPHAELIDLAEWMPKFIEEFSTGRECKVDYQWDPNQPNVKVDPSHLRQILTNLFDNGLRYSMEATGKAAINVYSGPSKNGDTSFIDVIDLGPGVPDEKVDEVFEPFFTTGQQGTGLGLYICRELCEINQATLNFQRTQDNKSCFKINFPHHQRMI